jgi:hypothetical protein
MKSHLSLVALILLLTASVFPTGAFADDSFVGPYDMSRVCGVPRSVSGLGSSILGYFGGYADGCRIVIVPNPNPDIPNRTYLVPIRPLSSREESRDPRMIAGQVESRRYAMIPDGSNSNSKGPGSSGDAVF